MRAFQTLTITAAMILGSASMASTKCNHRLSSGGGLFPYTVAPSSVVKAAQKAVAAVQSKVGVR